MTLEARLQGHMAESKLLAGDLSGFWHSVVFLEQDADSDNDVGVGDITRTILKMMIIITIIVLVKIL